MIVLQTADPYRYAPMLAVTQRNVADFCRRHGFVYEACVGICRGFHPWQASYNRIPLMQALIDRGHRGWVLYLDADAYVADPDFDLPAYLAAHREHAAIVATAGVSEARWDVNDGVMLVNLGHPRGRRLIELWGVKFAMLSDDRLRAAEQWLDDDNDQDLLHQLLREHADIADAVHVEARDLLNSGHARFIRQHLRSHTPDLAERIRAIAAEIAELAGGSAHAPALLEVPDAAPPPRTLIDEIVARWQKEPLDDAPVHQRDFASLLARGDVPGLQQMLAGMGRAALTQGLLGGARQHARARNREFADRLARSTQDRLVALADAVGVATSLAPDALFAAVERVLGADLSPPMTVGGYLGIDAGRGRVLHARMIEAIYAAWRLRTVCHAHRLDGIVEIGGGAGLTAAYAARLDLSNYRIVSNPIAAAIQAAVLGDASMVAAVWPDTPTDILFVQDMLPEMAFEQAAGLLRDARERGVRLLLSIGPDGSEGSSSVFPALMRDLVAAADGWRAAGRHRDWLRAGHVEEIWLAE